MGVVSRAFHQPFLAFTQAGLGKLVVGFNAQYGSPCCFGLFQLTQRMVMGGNLEAGVKMLAVAAYRSFEIGEGIVHLVELKVIQASLVPGRSVVGGLAQGFVQRTFCTLGTVHAHVTRCELGQRMGVVGSLFENVFEFL